MLCISPMLTDGPGGILFPMETGGPIYADIIYILEDVGWADVMVYCIDGWAEGVVEYVLYRRVGQCKGLLYRRVGRHTGIIL